MFLVSISDIFMFMAIWKHFVFLYHLSLHYITFYYYNYNRPRDGYNSLKYRTKFEKLEDSANFRMEVI